MDLGAALLAMSVSLGFKVIIMIVAGRMLLKMYQSTHQKAPKKLWLLVPEKDKKEFNYLYWSLIFFFFSEIFCGVETWVLLQSDAICRALHGITSAIGMGLFSVGMYEVFDDKLIHYGGKRCALNSICKGCPVREGLDCKFNSMVMLFGTFVFLAAIVPFFVKTDIIVADPSKFVLPFLGLNEWYDQTFIPFIQSLDPNYKPIGVAFFLPKSTQVIENKIFPALVMILSVIGLFQVRSREMKTKVRGFIMIVFSSGFLAYTYFEIAMNRMVGDLFLGAIGHEIAEFFFLVFLAEFLTRTFPPKVHEIKNNDTIDTSNLANEGVQ